MGLRNRPTYRIVVIDSRKARDGKYIEAIGNYNPRSKDLWINLERADHWMGVGARPTDTVLSLIKRRRKEGPSAAVVAEPPAATETAEVAAAEPVTEPAPEAPTAPEADAAEPTA
jgi:small subunit ribosomal protein S16